MTDPLLCCKCGGGVAARVALKVDGRWWHGDCLSCVICQRRLEFDRTCYFKDGLCFCKTHYFSIYGRKCKACRRTIHSEDWVRCASRDVFHLACFACSSCGRQFSTGEVCGLWDDKVLCLAHYEALVGGASDPESEGSSKSKRMRTSFTDEQVQILQSNFLLDTNPDSSELDRIAVQAGLSKRVTQVWFQNARARIKKSGGQPVGARLPT